MLHMEFLKGKRLYFVFISELIFISGISTPTFSALTLEISLWIVCRFFFQLVILICLFQTCPLPLIIVLLNLCVASSPVS